MRLGPLSEGGMAMLLVGVVLSGLVAWVAPDEWSLDNSWLTRVSVWLVAIAVGFFVWKRVSGGRLDEFDL